MGRTGLAIGIEGICEVVKLNDFRNAIGMLNMYLNSGIDAIYRHLRMKNISEEEIEDMIGCMELEGTRIKLYAKTREASDKLSSCYVTEITFPNIDNLLARPVKEQDND